MQKRPSSLQKSTTDINLVYDPIALDPQFPVTGAYKTTYVPDSDPLTLLHYHDHFEIGYCYEGSGVFIVDDKILPFSKGSASIIFRNEIHIAKSNPRNPSHWHFITMDPVRLLKDTGSEGFLQLFSCLDGVSGFENIVCMEDHPELVLVVKEIIEEVQNKNGLYKTAIKGLTLCLLSRLSRVASKTNTSIPPSHRSYIARISPALDYIYRNHSQQIQIPDLAAICGMSVTHFRRTFASALGISPLEYIHQFRVRMASVLLACTDMSILDISALVGYECLSGFNRHFKRIMGMAPREWRKRNE